MKRKSSTWNSKKKENTSLIASYQQFFFSQILDFNSRTKLLEEIQRLENQNEMIERMTSFERKQDDLGSIQITESRMNLLKTA